MSLFDFATNQKKTFAIIGLGLFGRRLARELAGMGHQLLVIDRDDDNVSPIQDEVTRAVVGDATQENLIEEFITPDLDAAVVTIGTSIEDSLLVTLHLKEVGVEEIHVKSNRREHTFILERLGISNFVMPEEDAADRLAQKLGRPGVEDLLHLSDGYSVMELEVPETMIERNLKELGLREKHGIQVIGIQRGGEGRTDMVPSPEYRFEAEDQVLLVGPQDVVEGLAQDPEKTLKSP